MSEQITRTITESLTHEDVQNAILELVAKRNPSYAKRDTDTVVFSRQYNVPLPPPLPGMPGMPAAAMSMHVDVKVTQDVLSKPSVFRESTPGVPTHPLWAQQFGRAMRPVQTADFQRIHDEFTLRRAPTFAKSDATMFECDLRSVHAFVQSLRAVSTAREDTEAHDYWADVMRVLWRDIGTVAAR